MSNPFANSALRDCLTENIPFNRISNLLIALEGDGPFELEDYVHYLNRSGVISNLEEQKKLTLIIGRNNWEKEKLIQLINGSKFEDIFIYSQEMFMFFILTGKDPLKLDKKTLNAFASDHPALLFLIENGFVWPHLSVKVNRKDDADNGNFFEDLKWEKEGYLAKYGYNVQERKKLTLIQRRFILTNIFEKIPYSEKTDYTKSWGYPKTSKRLKKMADSIAAFYNIGLKNKSNQKDCMSKWKRDLDWLKNEFYEKNGFNFKWPNKHS